MKDIYQIIHFTVIIVLLIIIENKDKEKALKDIKEDLILYRYIFTNVVILKQKVFAYHTFINSEGYFKISKKS